MPEYLVVCGWRSIKEVSLTLGSLCLQLPTKLIVKEEEDDGLLSLQQVILSDSGGREERCNGVHKEMNEFLEYEPGNKSTLDLALWDMF